MIACASKQLKLADYAVDANVTLDVETIWDAWELFSIQSASAVVLVVSPSLSMRYAAFFALVIHFHIVPCYPFSWLLCASKLMNRRLTLCITGIVFY